MKCAGFALLTMLLLHGGAVTQVGSHTTGNVQWVGGSLKKMQTITPGMTREDLQEVFVPDGGIASRKERIYVYRECPYFKVTVEFEPVPGGPASDARKDRITKISKPYLDWPTSD
jgi:hypothetical protein